MTRLRRPLTNVHTESPVHWQPIHAGIPTLTSHGIPYRAASRLNLAVISWVTTVHAGTEETDSGLLDRRASNIPECAAESKS